MWLGKVPLPIIQRSDTVPSANADLFERFDRSNVMHYDFDATTDLGIPTVLSVQTSRGHPYCALSVSCATELSPERAQFKALREACGGRTHMNRPYNIPSNINDFAALTDGAHYYGLGGHQDAFQYLLSRPRRSTTLACMEARTLPGSNNTDQDRLAFLIERLRELGLDAIAIDLSTDEVRGAGLWVVRVIIPKLMPISFVHRARYLGTPRLYDYVRRVKRQEFTERDVNAAPLPFA